MDYRNGFTLVELIITISLVVLLAGLTFPMGLDFVRSQIINSETHKVLTTLREAQSKAVAQNNDSDFGVKFLEDKYVLFQGSSYAGRVQTQDIEISESYGADISGIDEVVFEKLRGLPGTTGTLTVTTGSLERDININAEGKVEIE